MRLIHLADLHLGYRQFDRVGPRGVNQRELDVEQTWRVAVERIIGLAPDVIVVAGDVLHSPRPSANATLAMFRGFADLRTALPRAIIVVAAGNHDVHRATEHASMLQLLVTLDVHVADADARRIYFPDRDISVLVVPDIPGLVRPAFDPDPRARYNVAVVHGEMRGQLPASVSAERVGIEITTDELRPSAWTYVALGHWHVYQEIAPNCYYSGSIDYTSSNPWREIGVPKGFIERDLATGEHTFHHLPPSRPYIELPAIDATGMSPADVDAAIRAAVAAHPIDDAVARIRVSGITRDVSRALDQKALREYRRRALNFQVVEQRPDRIRPESRAMVRQLGTIAERLAQHLEQRELASDVDRDALVVLANRYLEQATERLDEGTEAEGVPIARPTAARKAS